MGYYLSRYGNALMVRKKWFLGVLFVLVSYLLLAAQYDVRYFVFQDVAPYDGKTAVALPNSPVGTMDLDELITDSDKFFIDGFTLPQLKKLLLPIDNTGELANENDLIRFVHFTMSLMKIDGTQIRLSYLGPDLSIGKAMVVFYRERLLKRIEEGNARTQLRSARPSEVIQPASRLIQPVGNISVEQIKSMWGGDRILPAITIVLFSFVIILIIIAFTEFFDTSFRSERQIARYLGVSILGVMPDAVPLVKSLPK